MSIFFAFQVAQKHGRGWKRGATVWQQNTACFNSERQSTVTPTEVLTGQRPHTRQTVFENNITAPSEVYEVTIYAPAPERLEKAWQHVLQVQHQLEGVMWVDKAGLQDVTPEDWKKMQEV